MGSFADFLSRASVLSIPVSGLRRKIRNQQGRVHKRLGLRVNGKAWEVPSPESPEPKVSSPVLRISKTRQVGVVGNPSYKV